MNELPEPSLLRASLKQLEAERSWARAVKNCQAKKAYRLEVHAKAHALQLMNNPRKRLRAEVPIYTYKCPMCGMYHLTKKTPKP